MSRRVLVPLGLLAMSSDPTGINQGDSYYNTVSDKIRIFDGTAWQDAGVSASDVADAISGAALDSTDDLTEGIQNLYYTNSRVATALNSGTLDNITFTYQSFDDTIDVSVPTVQGTTGAQGTQGIQGTTGTQGATGTQGDIGATGSQGTQGTTGAQGVTGSTGIQGETGSTGSQGVQGLTGTQGIQGTTGTQGVQGITGTATGTVPDILMLGGM